MTNDSFSPIENMFAKQFSKFNNPIGRLLIGNKILKIANMDVDELREVLEVHNFNHAEETAMLLAKLTEPFLAYKTRLKTLGVQSLFKDHKFVSHMKEVGKDIPDSFITIGVDQISNKLDNLIKIF